MRDIDSSNNNGGWSWITFGVIVLYDALYVAIHLTGLATSTIKDAMTGMILFIIGICYAIGLTPSTVSSKARWATAAIAFISWVVICG